MRVPIIKDYSILGSMLGSPYFGKLPEYYVGASFWIFWALAWLCLAFCEGIEIWDARSVMVVLGL